MMRLNLDIPPCAAVVFQGDHLLVETPESRQRLITSIQTQMEEIGPRKIPEILTNGTKIKNFYSIRDGVIYGRNNRRLKVQANGRVLIISPDSKLLSIHVGRLAANAYPEIYKISDGRHVDHINSDHNDNRLCNTRMLTYDQNQMVRDASKERTVICFQDSSQYHADASSYTVSSSEMERMVNNGSVKVYNSRWFHEQGVIWRKENDRFVLVQLSINRNGYLVYGYQKKNYQAHTEIMKAFGIDCPQDCDRINHIDRNKQNFAISNLEWTDRSGNCATRKACEITWQNGTITCCDSLVAAYRLLKTQNTENTKIGKHLARNQSYIGGTFTITLCN